MTDPRRFFDAIARRYDRVYAIDSRTSRARMTRVLSEIAGRRRVLDLGVGTGRELAALLDAGHEVEGVDVSKEMIAIAMRRSRPIAIAEHDFWTSLPFADGAFDAALALHGTLAHPPEERSYARLFAELARVLASGGVFVAEVPSNAWLDRLGTGERQDGEGRVVRRTGDEACVYEDRVVGASIEAFIPKDDRWAQLVGPAFSVRVDALGDDERLVVAQKRS